MLDERKEKERGPDAQQNFGGDVERPHFAPPFHPCGRVRRWSRRRWRWLLFRNAGMPRGVVFGKWAVVAAAAIASASFSFMVWCVWLFRIRGFSFGSDRDWFALNCYWV
jgi:hypothetical protein